MNLPVTTPVDPFDLPEWLGTDEVTWHVAGDTSNRATTTHRLAGTLVSARGELECDLLAVDQAWPRPVIDDAARTDVHQAWHNGQVVLAEHDGRLALLVPGTEFTADGILITLGRLAKAVGARPERFVAALRVGVVTDHG